MLKWPASTSSPPRSQGCFIRGAVSHGAQATDLPRPGGSSGPPISTFARRARPCRARIPVGSESPRLHYDRSSTGPWVVPLLITSLSANVTTLRSPPRRRPAGGRRSQETPCALGRSRDHGIDETAVTNVINKARQPPLDGIGALNRLQFVEANAGFRWIHDLTVQPISRGRRVARSTISGEKSAEVLPVAAPT